MRSSKGRHYREFVPKGAQQFCIDFPSILVTFWSPGMLLAALAGSPGPGRRFSMNFEPILTHLGLSRGPLDHHLDPVGCHCAARARTFDDFLVLSARDLIFHHFLVGKRSQK